MQPPLSSSAPAAAAPLRVISGGETGADQGGMEAAIDLGLPTGGTAPPNFRTESGPNMALKV